MFTVALLCLHNENGAQGKKNKYLHWHCNYIPVTILHFFVATPSTYRFSTASLVTRVTKFHRFEVQCWQDLVFTTLRRAVECWVVVYFVLSEIVSSRSPVETIASSFKTKEPPACTPSNYVPLPDTVRTIHTREKEKPIHAIRTSSGTQISNKTTACVICRKKYGGSGDKGSFQTVRRHTSQERGGQPAIHMIVYTLDLSCHIHSNTLTYIYYAPVCQSLCMSVWLAAS